MINLETSQFSIILGADELKRQAPKDAAAVTLVIESYPLSDDEAVTEFTILAPAEASVIGELRESILRMPSVCEALSLRMALIRWSDGTESLVGFPASETVPSPNLLRSAYRSGYGAGQLAAMVAKRAEELRHG